MVGWKKHLRYIPRKKSENSATLGLQSSPAVGNKFASFLPEVYAGQPQRIERYNQYDIMDNDPEINAALDTIAEFSTQLTEKDNLPFEIVLDEDISESEAEILKESLKKWCLLNDFPSRIFKIFRNVIKYGDQFFIRDPETQKLLWVDHAKVISVIVNQSKGKFPEMYVISDLDLNLRNSVATTPPPAYQQTTGLIARSPGPLTHSFPRGDTTLARYTNFTSSYYIPAEHVLHVSLSDGLDNNWPFGNSILESVFKVYKQKELLEDSIIIYRVQRAPERRVFYIDVGNMPTHKAMQFIERVKNEIHQRRIPNRTGGGSSILDAAFNPLSMLEDYFFAQTADGRGSKVETLPGGEQLGQIDDLLYFDNKLKRGLKVPVSYLPGGQDDSGGAQYSDGKIGSAFIQEYRFTKYCKRLQSQIISFFDKEFKTYLKNKQINIDNISFSIRFVEPQSFSKYRQIEIDNAQVSIFTSLADYNFLSKRFLLKRYLNLSHQEILENEKLWKEENGIEESTSTSDDAEKIGIKHKIDLENEEENEFEENEFREEGEEDIEKSI